MKSSALVWVQIHRATYGGTFKIVDMVKLKCIHSIVRATYPQPVYASRASRMTSLMLVGLVNIRRSIAVT